MRPYSVATVFLCILIALFMCDAHADGTAYLQSCNKAGVPTPPGWNDPAWGTGAAVTTTFLTDPNTGKYDNARLFTYQSAAPNPQGVCLALPRDNGTNIVQLGVICLGTAAGNQNTACFWDNQDVTKPIGKRAYNIPLTYTGTPPIYPIVANATYPGFAGGPDLDAQTGGVCSDCHAGQNPYVIHPNDPGMAALLALNISMPPNWYTPIVVASWPQNPGPANLAGVTINPGQANCTRAACHVANKAGSFPAVSTMTPGYCQTILQGTYHTEVAGMSVSNAAITTLGTMPPSNPGDGTYPPTFGAYAPIYQALQAMCSNPPPASGPAANGPLPVWSLIALTLLVFGTAAWRFGYRGHSLAR